MRSLLPENAYAYYERLRARDGHEERERLKMGKTIIITAGATAERIDDDMRLTNMSTGGLAALIAETLLAEHGDEIDLIIYMSLALTRKPTPNKKIRYADGIKSADKMLYALEYYLTSPDMHVDAVIHAATVNDYKKRYVACAGDIADEIADQVMEAMDPRDPMDANMVHDIVINVLANPACARDDSAKVSGYEKDLMVMLDPTPKVIEGIKGFSPNTMLIGFKNLENASKRHLFDVASVLRQKAGADYVVANDPTCIDSKGRPSLIVGYDGHAQRDGLVEECETMNDIAKAISRLVFAKQGTVRTLMGPEDIKDW